MSGIAAAQQDAGKPILNETGEPLKPNERYVPRAEFDAAMEAHWGIRLSDIDDEFVKKIGNETLFIAADGRIFIKKDARGYAGETGKSYESTEAMLNAEARWEELAERAERMRSRLLTLTERVAAAAASIVITSEDPVPLRGATCNLRIRMAGIARREATTLGLAIAVESDAARIDAIEAADRFEIVRQDTAVRGGRTIVRAILERKGGTDSGRSAGAVHTATLRLVPLRSGQMRAEPLSSSATPEFGKTFIRTSTRTIAPVLRPFEVRVY